MMATVQLHKAPLSENGRLALLRLEKLAERQASRGDYIGTEDVESILRVVRELAESEATLLTPRATPETVERGEWPEFTQAYARAAHMMASAPPGPGPALAINPTEIYSKPIEAAAAIAANSEKGDGNGME